MAAVMNPAIPTTAATAASGLTPAAVPKPERPEEAELSYPFKDIPALGQVFDVTPHGVSPRVRWLDRKSVV